jgi:hypothetical protein
MEEIREHFEKGTIQDVSIFKKEILGRAKWYRDVQELQDKKNAMFFLELQLKYADECSLKNYQLTIDSDYGDGYYMRKATKDVAGKFYDQNNFTHGRIMNLADILEKQCNTK